MTKNVFVLFFCLCLHSTGINNDVLEKLEKDINRVWHNLSAFLQLSTIKVGKNIYGYTGWPKKNGTVDFSGLCSDQQLSFFTLLDKTSFSHYNNTKIIKFG